jgi:[protein-PII] uridylyltransferase
VSLSPHSPPGIHQRIQQRKAALAAIRTGGRERRAEGKSGIECSTWLSDQIDQFVRDSFNFVAGERARELKDACTLLAIGGSGRKRPAPYSDIDLLVILDPRLQSEVEPLITAAIRDCWDSGAQPACTVRTPEDVVAFSALDIPFATSLMETRVLQGNSGIAEAALQQVQSKVLSRDRSGLILKLMASRREEWIARGNSVNQLEPDVKRSPGGLRDIQLLRWVAFLRHGIPDPQALRGAGEISEQELEQLNLADEFLTALRFDLHVQQGLKQDVLTRELQLKISSARGISGSNPSRPVEVFMQQYFDHTSRVAAIARRVADVPRKLPLLARLKNVFLPRKSPQGFLIVDGVLQVSPHFLHSLQDPVKILEVFVAATQNQARLAPELKRRIGHAAASLPEEPTYEMTEQFREILRSAPGLAETLRAMVETRVLDWLVPPFREIRNLMQFNQYHSFTVDEHTLKTIDEVTAFASDKSPVGSAYKEIRHRATLHLALLMHDIGKGRVGDHSVIGEQLAEEVAVRLQLAANKKSMLMFLVRHHLIMPDIAFRRDLSDRGMLIDFARLIGAPEQLRMLYCLTVADIRAVGPDVWSDWKGELLADLYDRTSLILSGRPYNHLEREKLQEIRMTVRKSFIPADRSGPDTAEEWRQWADRQLDTLPPMYLMNQQPSRIARDLAMIQQLSEQDVKIEGEFDAEKELVSYRVFAPARFANGSFHRIAGVLSGLGMDIMDAQICTSSNGFVIASFRVHDRDFKGVVPHSRIEAVAIVIGDVLTARKAVESVFRKSRVVLKNHQKAVMIKQDPKVAFDNDCSQRYTVIDVFATDTQGLLFTLAQTLFNHGLTVYLARIDTSIDQVVDVFYVLDQDQKKLEDQEKIHQVRTSLLNEIRQISQ